MQLMDMKQARHEITGKIEAVLQKAGDEQRALTDRDQKDLVSLRADASQLDTQIRQREELSTIRQFDPVAMLTGRLVKPGEADPRDTPRGPIQRRGNSIAMAMQHATPEQREEITSFASYLGGNISALANLTPSGDGGVFIPTMVASWVERNIAAFTPVLNNCRVWPTADGEPTKFPVVSDSEDAEILAPAALTGADATVSGDTPPTTVGGPTMGAYKFSSKPVFIPRETITDSTLNVLDVIMEALLKRIYRHQNLKYTKGNGTTEPEGFLENCSVMTSSSALDLDLALDLAYSVPPLYRPNGIYMASDTTIKYMRKLKTGISGDKRNLWKDVFEEGNATLGTPAKLHGYPIIVNNDMDSVASNGTYAGVSPLAFGDFSRFVVRQAEQGSPYVYRYVVPAKDGGAAIAFQRSDSKLLVTTAISRLVQSGS